MWLASFFVAINITYLHVYRWYSFTLVQMPLYAQLFPIHFIQTFFFSLSVCEDLLVFTRKDTVKCYTHGAYSKQIECYKKKFGYKKLFEIKCDFLPTLLRLSQCLFKCDDERWVRCSVFKMCWWNRMLNEWFWPTVIQTHSKWTKNSWNCVFFSSVQTKWIV